MNHIGGPGGDSILGFVAAAQESSGSINPFNEFLGIFREFLGGEMLRGLNEAFSSFMNPQNVETITRLGNTFGNFFTAIMKPGVPIIKAILSFLNIIKPALVAFGAMLDLLNKILPSNAPLGDITQFNDAFAGLLGAIGKEQLKALVGGLKDISGTINQFKDDIWKGISGSERKESEWGWDI